MDELPLELLPALLDPLLPELPLDDDGARDGSRSRVADEEVVPGLE